MPRELVVQLIARKKALNAEKFEIDEALSALPPEHLWVVNKDPTEYPLELTPEETKVKESFLSLSDRKLRVQTQLDRAERFRTRHTGGVLPPFCLDCFIDQDEDSLMVEIGTDLNGIRKFECPACTRILPVDPL